MSHQADYAKELEGFETIEKPYGFISYKFLQEVDECFIRDVYVSPDFRSDNTSAKALLEEVEAIAREAKFKYVTGLVVPSMRNATYNMQAQIKHGFKIFRSELDKIWMIKEL